MNKPSSIFRRFLWAFMALASVCFAGCAKDIPVFVPPAERTVASNEKPWPKNHYLALGYHAVQDDTADQTYVAVRTDQLLGHLHWLHKNGYQAVSTDQILAAQKGGQELPPKAVLLSFDDGYKDFYTRVIPFLNGLNWPAVLAPVGSWVLTPKDRPIIFGDTPAPRELFLNQKELAEVAKSPLVEIGAHTYQSHMGSVANPQGNSMPRIANHLYLDNQKRYETSEEFQSRVREDVRAVTRVLQDITGKKPRVWVWPYGRTNGEAQEVITSEGYQLFLTLEPGLGNVANPESVPRMLVTGRDSIETIASLMTDEAPSPSLRVAHIDLDYLYDPSLEQQDKNLDKLVQRMADLKINTVFLQAYADTAGDGLVREVYFPNSVLPMRADLFNRVAWQLASRGGVRVYAWMPVLSLNLDNSYPRVLAWNPKNNERYVEDKQYQRLSPFSEINRKAIGRLYEDLSRNASFAGILFHDDAILSDFEDVSEDALNFYANAGLPRDISKIRDDAELMQKWTRLKSKFLVEFTNDLAKKVKSIRGHEIKTARNMFVEPILRPHAESWFAQNLKDFLENYDWTAPMAMPYMEGVAKEDAGKWLDSVVDAVAKYPGAIDRTIFEIQARDWRNTAEVQKEGNLIDSKILANWMRRLQLRGVKHYGYYPDDFTINHPEIDVIRPQISNAWYPFK